MGEGEGGKKKGLRGWGGRIKKGDKKARETWEGRVRAVDAVRRCWQAVLQGHILDYGLLFI